MSDIKELYLRQIAAGWKHVEETAGDAKISAIIDYVSDSLHIAEKIGAQEEAKAFLARKIRSHRRSLDAHVRQLEQQMTEKQEIAGAIHDLRTRCGLNGQRTTKEQEHRDELLQYAEINTRNPRLTPHYIRTIQSNKTHDLLRGPEGYVTKAGLNAWEQYFATHGLYRDLVKNILVNHHKIKKRQSEVRHFLTNIGGRGRKAEWTYLLTDAPKIEQILCERSYTRRQNTLPEIPTEDRIVLERLHISRYGLDRLKKAGLVQAHRGQYHQPDIRNLEENLEGKTLIDDEAASSCERHRLDPEQTAAFIDKVYLHLHQALPRELETFSLFKFGENIFIYNPRHGSSETLQRELFNPLLKRFLTP